MKANSGQCLNLVSFSSNNIECSCRPTDPPGQDASPLHVPLNVGTHYNKQLSILRQIVVNEIR